MATATIIAACALVVSAVAFFVNYRLARNAAVRARRPVLAFVWRARPGFEGSWVLTNVGNGPAMNVLVAARAFHPALAGEWGGDAPPWLNPVRLPPIAVDGELECGWLFLPGDMGLAAEYTDSEGRAYTMTTGDDTTVVLEGRHLPSWSRDEVVPYWQLEGDVFRVSAWAARASDFPAGVRPAGSNPLLG